MDFSSLFCRSLSPWRLSQRGAMFTVCDCNFLDNLCDFVVNYSVDLRGFECVGWWTRKGRRDDSVNFRRNFC